LLKLRETFARKKIMGRKSAKPSLHLVPPTGTVENSPPRTLGEHGSSLWKRVMIEYHIEDVGGRELLALACQQLDRAEALKTQIDAEGEIIQTRNGLKDHPALRHELQARAFVAKILLRLGLNVEPVRPAPGRPSGQASGWIPPDDR
jgi:phage terminase small subunit